MIKQLAYLWILALNIALAGCASLNTLTSDVQSFGQWPTDRKPGTFIFERLPSQQARADVQQILETAALPALEAVGFKLIPDPKEAEFLVQLGARSSPSQQFSGDSFYAWQGVPHAYPSYNTHTHLYGYGRGLWAFPIDIPRYEREVVVMIRDPKQGTNLYESHAVNDGPSANLMGLLGPMFFAALKDFPSTSPTPKKVTLPLNP
jgi:hypothetical protein